MTGAGFGARLREWRRRRGFSQLALSLLAQVSARHLSWLESDKASPSRAMVLRLAEQLDVPLRERNAWLEAAGYAALYAEHAWGEPACAEARAAVQRLLDAHEPFPALAVDRGWQLVAHNRMVPLLIGALAPTLAQPPVNVLRLSLHPEGLAPHIDGLADWRHHVLSRLERQIRHGGDAALQALHEELRKLPPPAGHPPWPAHGAHDAHPEPGDRPRAPSDVAVPLKLRSPFGTLNFITTLTVFGAPRDITLSELAIETLLPADAATGEALRQIRAQAVEAVSDAGPRPAGPGARRTASVANP
ncbi:MAG: helix-turn-helix domain-containing protein [Rubrivivax sp.]|nr:helix-turn-helix domain-containing protein [Rubrivivax sp.]